MDLIERLPAGAPRHPWEIARSKFILSLLRYYKLSTYSTWLDVGCGDAWLARRILQSITSSPRFVGWDINYNDQDIATLTNDTQIELVAEQPSGQFQVILMLDVLEHIANDTSFLRHVVLNLLEANGWILITVPAYQFLFSEHDRILQHFRRYSPSACRQLLIASGLQIVNQGGLYSSLLLARLAQKLPVGHPTNVRKTAAVWNQSSTLTNVLTSVLESEGAFDFWLSLKCQRVLPGLSYWAVCRKSN